ncbi:MAG: PilN domain-containing protein [Phycisphaerales bacterium]|jgi:hypothetical protein|nr:PilN domain-containing protein [Phycisphaerales bacterium]
MSLHGIDLMPASVRACAEAGQRLRRTIGFCLAVAILAGGATTWSSIRAEQTGRDLVRLEALARQSLELESQTIACAKAARDIEAAVQDYRDVALPMPVSSLLAGIVESLPAGSTLESLSMEYDDGRRMGTDDAEPRQLLGAIEGYAASDEDVATVARRMGGQAAFEDVRLEASRSRTVRGRPARGFSILFTIDLDRSFIVQRPEDVRQDEAMARAEEAAE